MAKTLNGDTFIKSNPKRTTQGQGTNSKPKKGKKLRIGQGK